MSHEHNPELFDLAVRMIREKRLNNLEIIYAVEDAGAGRNAGLLVADADKYLRELQIQAEAAAIDALRRGETTLEVEKKLRALGFHSWDAMALVAAQVAKLAQNATDD